MRPVRLGVVIVSWNVRSLLRRCLVTVRSGALPMHVVVVDNASRDGTVTMLRRDFPDVTVIANRTNQGFTRANNQGFEALGVGRGEAPPYVMILNPDTEIVGNALEVLVEHLDAHPSVGAVGPLLLWPDGDVQRSRRRFPSLLTGLLESTPLAWHWPSNPVARHHHLDDVPPDVAGPVDWVTGAAIAFRSRALEAVGGFDEAFFMYSEEVDLCRRLKDAGWETHYTPDARIVHHEGKSSEQVVPARHLHFQRSRVRYFRKHHGRRTALLVQAGILAGYALEILIEGLKWLVGHRRPLRRARVRVYWRVLRDGLGVGSTDAAQR